MFFYVDVIRFPLLVNTRGVFIWTRPCTHTRTTHKTQQISRVPTKKIEGTRTNISGIREQRRKRKVSYLRRLKGEGVSQFTTSHISRAHFQRQSPPRAKLRTYNATVSQNSTLGAFFFLLAAWEKSRTLYLRKTKNEEYLRFCCSSSSSSPLLF